MTWINNKIGRNVFRILLVGFAIVGLFFSFVYVAMKFSWFNVRGSASQRNSYFNLNKITNNDISSIDKNNMEIICKINVLNKYAPFTSVNIYKTLTKGNNDLLINQMIDVASKRFENNPTFNNNMNNCIGSSNQNLNLSMSAFNWADTDQWALMKEVFTRDQDIINKAAHDAGISPRYILSGVIGEQFRFFNNRRESFKSYFEPLKILASLSNTSFGIAGIKPKTVTQIEENLKNKNSPFYLGPEMEHILDYKPGEDPAIEGMNRITDVRNPYYSYLYVGLYLRQIEAQWQKAGYDISGRPEILATLYNLGFYYSMPKADPQVGGSIINIDNVNYTFGDIAYEFYYSGELSDIFPFDVQ
jgi:hypothetical protein